MSLTHEQLDQAELLCSQITTTADMMRILAIQARDGTIDSIVLTPDQLQHMITSYLAGKAALVELYNQLP